MKDIKGKECGLKQCPKQEVKKGDEQIREIKFRAWNDERKVMRNVNNIDMQFMEVITDEEEFYEKFHLGFDGHTLMQFTGLEDKNGEDIYEGDILEYSNALFIIEWDSDSGCFYLQKITEDNIIHDIRMNRLDVSAKIMGNKFENPVLLKEAKRCI